MILCFSNIFICEFKWINCQLFEYALFVTANKSLCFTIHCCKFWWGLERYCLEVISFQRARSCAYYTVYLWILWQKNKSKCLLTLSIVQDSSVVRASCNWSYSMRVQISVWSIFAGNTFKKATQIGEYLETIKKSSFR